MWKAKDKARVEMSKPSPSLGGMVGIYPKPGGWAPVLASEK